MRLFNNRKVDQYGVLEIFLTSSFAWVLNTPVMLMVFFIFHFFIVFIYYSQETTFADEELKIHYCSEIMFWCPKKYKFSVAK